MTAEPATDAEDEETRLLPLTSVMTTSEASGMHVLPDASYVPSASGDDDVTVPLNVSVLEPDAVVIEMNDRVNVCVPFTRTREGLPPTRTSSFVVTAAVTEDDVRK